MHAKITVELTHDDGTVTSETVHHEQYEVSQKQGMTLLAGQPHKNGQRTLTIKAWSGMKKFEDFKALKIPK